MSKKQQFEALLKAKKPSGVSQTGMDKAKEYFLEQNWLEGKVLHECVRECIALAQRFDSAAAVASPLDADLVQHLRMAPQDLMTSDDLTEKIRPEVEQVRHTLFGSPCPPFATYENAVQWLEQTAAAQEAEARALDPKRELLRQSICEKLEELQSLTGDGYTLPFRPDLLEYAKPGDQWVHRVSIWGRTSLADLGSASRQIADATGFSQACVVSYILAGIRPLLVPIRMSTSWGASNTFNIFRGSVTLALRNPNVTDAQLKTIRQVIRRAWRTEKKKPLTEGDKQFLDIVHRLGGVPEDKRHGEHKAFFELLRQEFNAWAVEHGCRLHKEWKVTRNKYYRLFKKLRQDGPYAQEAPILRRRSTYDAYL